MQEDPTADFLARLDRALAQQTFVKLILAKPRGAGRLRVTARVVMLKGEARLSFVDSHPTRDVTRNLERGAALAEVGEALGDTFCHAHLFTTREEIQLLLSKKGKQTLLCAALNPELVAARLDHP